MPVKRSQQTFFGSNATFFYYNRFNKVVTIGQKMDIKIWNFGIQLSLCLEKIPPVVFCQLEKVEIRDTLVYNYLPPSHTPFLESFLNNLKTSADIDIMKLVLLYAPSIGRIHTKFLQNRSVF